MEALFLLAIIGTSLVAVRLYLNGVREAPAAPAQPAPVPEAPAPVRRRRAPAKPAGASPSSSSDRWPGGPCPKCGNQVAAGVKFCGECGNRLAT